MHLSEIARFKGGYEEVGNNNLAHGLEVLRLRLGYEMVCQMIRKYT